MRLNSAVLLPLLCIAPGFGQANGAENQAVKRVVIIKVDGLPRGVLDQYIARSSRQTYLGELQSKGVSLDNFYTRGLSLSAPSWSMLDTGRHLEIHGNVEYDRYTLRPWDYLNFFPFYVGNALMRQEDMPAVQYLDQQFQERLKLGGEAPGPLLIDRFRPEQRYQGFQLLQRGIRWTTLQESLQTEFTKRPLRDLFDEWQTGFSMSDSVMLSVEQEMLVQMRNPEVHYLDFFTGEYDHVAHLAADRQVQMHVLDSLDALVGRVWANVQGSPLADSTLLVVISDHGMNTDDRIVSQGYNLVDWFNSAAGGAHHVITNRHPMAEFKLKGLDPFVSEVITPSRAATYLKGRSNEYPTAVLDLDGNERASIALRENGFNILQILSEQLASKRYTGIHRVALLNAFVKERDARRTAWEREAAEIEHNLATLRQRIGEHESVSKLGPQLKRPFRRKKSESEADQDLRRAYERLERWRAEERADTAYLVALQKLLSLTAADFDPGKFRTEEIIARKSLGGTNSIYDLQNYIAGPSPEGPILNNDGSLDMDASFRKVNYFEALSNIETRNQVQPGVAKKPIDFVAVRVAQDQLREAFGDPSLNDGVWLWRGPASQALVLTRGQGEIQIVPIENLTEDKTGHLRFDRCAWAEGFPLELFEDPDLQVPAAERTEWLSQWHSEREWLNAVYKTRYSNGIIGLTEQLLDPPDSADSQSARRRHRLRSDLLVFANNHWNFNVRGFNPGGNHGSFLRASTHSVLIMAGGNKTGIPQNAHIETPFDSLSFVPTVLKLIGKPDPDLPGPIIKEITPEK